MKDFKLLQFVLGVLLLILDLDDGRFWYNSWIFGNFAQTLTCICSWKDSSAITMGSLSSLMKFIVPCVPMETW